MITLFLAQASGNDEQVAETLTRSQQLLQNIYVWIAQKGLKFAMSLLTAIIIYLLGSWLASIVRSMVTRLMGKRGMDPTFASYLANILHGVLIVLVVITALGQLGIPTDH